MALCLTCAQGLDEFIAPEHRPPIYGGVGVDLGQSPDHLGFLALANDWKDEAPVAPPLARQSSDQSPASPASDDDDRDDEGAGVLSWLQTLVAGRGTNSQAYLGDKNWWVHRLLLLRRSLSACL